MGTGSLLLALACLQYNLEYNQILGARGPIQEAIQNGAAAEYHRDECTWRRDSEHRCPDPDIHVYIHKYGKEKIELKYGSEGNYNWLNNDLYDGRRDNVLLIHGYNGGDDVLPTSILRDTYLRNGSYNVFFVDWGKLGPAPCYPAAVVNINFVANCVAQTLTTLRDLGLSVSRITCIGHSLGAHICGIISNYLPFRMPKIIGLDPARPLVRPGWRHRLDMRDADFVQVIHTNAGYYGESMREGHVDFCANGGKTQPFCADSDRVELCNHNWSLCFMCDSIDGRSENFAEPCSGRCPPTRRVGPRSIINRLVIGHHTPTNTRGAFCVTTNDSPYCPKNDQDRGDKRCCV